MKVNFVNYNGIKGYARVMYNDVKEASNDVKIDVCYDGKDVKALLEYLFELENGIEGALKEIHKNKYMIDIGRVIEILEESLKEGDK